MKNWLTVLYSIWLYKGTTFKSHYLICIKTIVMESYIIYEMFIPIYISINASLPHFLNT
jgi:hypothetical protein